MEGGYVLDFSNRTIEDFFYDHFGIEFYSTRFKTLGDSKGKILRQIIELEPENKVSEIIFSLWRYRSALPEYYKLDTPDGEQRLEHEVRAIAQRLQGDAPATQNTFTQFDDSESLSVLIQSIEASIREDAWQAAIDRLHTYCMKRFRYGLTAASINFDQNEPLHSLAAKYAKTLHDNYGSGLAKRIVSVNVSVFEELNSIRNNNSLAHDSPQIIPYHEARFAIDAICAVIRYLDAKESSW